MRNAFLASMAVMTAKRNPENIRITGRQPPPAPFAPVDDGLPQPRRKGRSMEVV
jgi:hypothetical protein